MTKTSRLLELERIKNGYTDGFENELTLEEKHEYQSLLAEIEKADLSLGLLAGMLQCTIDELGDKILELKKNQRTQEDIDELKELKFHDKMNKEVIESQKGQMNWQEQENQQLKVQVNNLEKQFENKQIEVLEQSGIIRELESKLKEIIEFINSEKFDDILGSHCFGDIDGCDIEYKKIKEDLLKAIVERK